MAEEKTPSAEQLSGLLSEKDRELIEKIREAGSFNIEGLSNSLRATPAARRLAQENQIDLETVQGSGPNGRIQEEDVLAVIRPEEKVVAEIQEEESKIDAVSEAEQDLMAKVAEELKQQSGLGEGLLETQMQDLVKSAIQEMVAENQPRPFEAADEPNPGMDEELDMSLEELVKNAGGNTETMEMESVEEEKSEVLEDTQNTELEEVQISEVEELMSAVPDNKSDESDTATEIKQITEEKQETDGSEVSKETSAQKEEIRVNASPLAKRMAKANALDLGNMQGSGPNGKIVKADILSMLTFEKTEDTVISLAADASVEALVKTLALFEQEGMQYTLEDFIERACVCALEQYPAFNNGSSISLAAPVLVNQTEIQMRVTDQCEGKTFSEFVRLRQESEESTELAHSTFMVMHLGGLGIVDFSDAIPKGMRAMLCTGKITQELYLEDGEVKSQRLMRLRLNMRQEAGDSAAGAVFLHTICTLIENPKQML